jgi:methionine-rich copper-binding protein CopC
MNQKKATSGFAISKILLLAIILLTFAKGTHAAVTTSKPLAGPKSGAAPIKVNSLPDTTKPTPKPQAVAYPTDQPSTLSQDPKIMTIQGQKISSKKTGTASRALKCKLLP